MEAPPGAGKTTLVASYVTARDIPCLWYRVDATDQDIGSFFHHMGIAAKVVCGGKAVDLPRLGPEHRGGGEVFTRNFFRRLFECIPCQLVVFDDYHEVGADSPLHEVLALGMAELPAGYRAMVLSRSPPPKEFARLQSARSLELLDPRALLLTEDETLTLCHTFGKAHELPLSSVACAGLRSKCGGWVTGLILMLEARRTRDFPLQHADGAVPAVVFDYFASEILSLTDSETERVLLSTAMLEEITPKMAVALSGVDDADRRLDRLSQRGYFTVRHEARTPTWRYHQLFRQFLMRQAADQFGVEDWSALQSRAARELVAAGNVEGAVELYRSLCDWQSLASLLTNYAPLFLVQGMNRSVLRWFDDIPSDLQASSPWLVYWSAIARMPFEPGVAGEDFERAFQMFQVSEDVRGTFLAWAMGVVSIFHEQTELGRFDTKLQELGPLLERFDFPDDSVEAFVYASLAQGVLWHSLEHPSRDDWVDRALVLQEKLPVPLIRIQFLALTHSALIYAGEVSRRQQVLSLLHNLADGESSTSIASYALKATECFDYWTRAEFALSASAREEGLAAAEATGVVVMVPLIVTAGAAYALSLGDRKLASSILAQMDKTTDPCRRQEYGLFQLLRGWEASLSGDWRGANDWFERGSATLKPLDAHIFSARNDILQAVARHHLGDSDGGLELIGRARERVGSRGRFLLYGAAMAEAEIALDNGGKPSARRALSEALAIGRESGFWNFFGWRREALSRLCAEALAAGIEVSYTLALIEKHGLLPPDNSDIDLADWPWPVVVRGLGGFELSISGEHVQFSGKMPRKPLELLELLVIRGGKQVPEDWLADTLWPDADGDAAVRSLSTTILRLRKLLGVKGLLIRRNRCLTLDRRRCWVDAWALEDALQALPSFDDATSIVSTAEQVVSLHGGPFMPQSNLPPTLGYRERLLRRTVDSLNNTVERLETVGQSRHAAAIAERVRTLCDQTDHTV